MLHPVTEVTHQIGDQDRHAYADGYLRGRENDGDPERAPKLRVVQRLFVIVQPHEHRVADEVPVLERQPHRRPERHQEQDDVVHDEKREDAAAEKAHALDAAARHSRPPRPRRHITNARRGV